MSLGLKQFKHSASLSEETLAFDAVVTWEGRPIATARNDGRGGMTLLRPLQPGDYAPADLAAAKAANATREREYLQLTPDTVGQFGGDLEDWVDALAGREVAIARVQRSLTRTAKKGTTTLAMEANGHVTEFNAPPSHPGIPAAVKEIGAVNLSVMSMRAAATLVVDTQHSLEQERLKAAHTAATAPASSPSP